MHDTAANKQIQIATTVKQFQEAEKRVLDDPRGRSAAAAARLNLALWQSL
jgi:hypothetical protein